MTSNWSLPTPTDDDVVELNRLNKLEGVPVYVPYVEKGYQPAFCHISAKDVAIKEGGKRVHGWSYWRMTDASPAGTYHLMMAEHHSVWENKDGDLVDVTPPRHGGNKTLFLRDDRAEVVGSNGEIQVRTNMADLTAGVYLRDGKDVNYTMYPLPEDETKLAYAYAEEIGFDMARYPTDGQHG